MRLLCKCGKHVTYQPGTNAKCPWCSQLLPGEVQAELLPTWVKIVFRLRKDGELGVGDTIRRIAAKFGGEQFKHFSAMIGIPCGCAKRQAKWNTRWPY